MIINEFIIFYGKNYWFAMMERLLNNVYELSFQFFTTLFL
jgi:hypothetical protein